VLQRTVKKPTLLRLTRPLCTLLFAVAGSAAVAQMLQGEVYLSLRAQVRNAELAGSFARLLAIGTLALLLGTLGWRAVLRSVQYADRVSQEECTTRLKAMRVGLWGTALVVPLALVAGLDASPLASFFR
jgi:hypothetical protein